MDRDRMLNDYFDNSTKAANLILIENKKKIEKNPEPIIPSEKEVQELSHRIGATFKSRKKRRQVCICKNSKKMVES